MNKSARPPAVVAELGRPETSEETAARKAEDSRNHRKRRTLNNLLYAVLATLALVLVIVLVVPHPGPTINLNIDYAAVAQQAQGTVPQNLAVPQLPEGWRSNVAELRTNPSDGIRTWFIGFITPSDQFIGMAQGIDANTTWVAERVQQSIPTGTITITGTPWVTYDNRASTDDVGNVKYALVTQAEKSSYVLYGTANDNEFNTLATALQPSFSASNEKTE